MTCSHARCEGAHTMTSLRYRCLRSLDKSTKSGATSGRLLNAFSAPLVADPPRNCVESNAHEAPALPFGCEAVKSCSTNHGPSAFDCA